MPDTEEPKRKSINLCMRSKRCKVKALDKERRLEQVCGIDVRPVAMED